MPVYYLTHIGGLDEIVEGEIHEKLPGAQMLPGEYGRRHLQYDGPPGTILTLCTIENAYLYVLRLPARPEVAWLDDLEAALAAVDLAPAVQALRQLREVPEPPSFRVTAERIGHHDYHSPEVAAAAGAGLVTGMGWPVRMRDFDVEVRVDVRGDDALVGVRLSKESLHKRSRVVHPRVTLNPTLAAAMVRVSEPAAGQVVVDPLCGGGTILTERYDYDADVTLVGGDLFPEKVALARQNFEALRVPAHLVQWDARRLPLGEETVDRFLSNPPWGNLVADTQINRRLYPWMLGHMRRCLKPGGLMVLVTSERRLIQSFVDRHEDVTLVSVRKVRVGGLAPALFVLRKA